MILWVWLGLFEQLVWGYYEASVRMIGGTEIELPDHKFLVFIYHTHQNAQCAGTMVSGHALVTAGHCIYTDDVSHYDVRAKIHNVSRKAYEAWIPLEVTDLVTPKIYSKASKKNDIALIIVKPNPEVDTFLELDSENQARLGAEFEAMGWGFTKPNSRSSQVPNRLPIKVIDDEQCVKDFEMNYFNNCSFCGAGIEINTSTCRGDSGGPVLTNDGKTLVGLVSFGSPNCNTAGAAFTRIYLFNEWIKDKINLYSLKYESSPKYEASNRILSE
ncbi:Chymotrypsin-like elastase member 3B, partial [Massospora cicadina]